MDGAEGATSTDHRVRTHDETMEDAVRHAALLLVPNVDWVGYATMLNFAIWRLNG